MVLSTHVTIQYHMCFWWGLLERELKVCIYDKRLSREKVRRCIKLVAGSICEMV